MKAVGIFLAGQQGDILEASCVLKYRKELFGDAKIIWWIDDNNRDLLKHQDIELRTFPRGFGHPEMVIEENKKLIDAGRKPTWEDWSVLVKENNQLNISLKENYPSLDDIGFGYFPCAHQMSPEKRHGLLYANIPKQVFGVPVNWEWHPYLLFSDKERKMADEFMSKMGVGKKILIETFAGSGQSKLDESMILATMMLCKEKWGKCNFIFASHKFLNGNERFPEYLFEQPDIFSCSDFTVRQCALIANQCDLMVSVSSGISVAASCWGNKPIPTIQFAGSEVCGTRAISNGNYTLVTHDEKNIEDAKEEYYSALTKILNQFK